MGSGASGHGVETCHGACMGLWDHEAAGAWGHGGAEAGGVPEPLKLS